METVSFIVNRVTSETESKSFSSKLKALQRSAAWMATLQSIVQPQFEQKSYSGLNCMIIKLISFTISPPTITVLSFSVNPFRCISAPLHCSVPFLWFPLNHPECSNLCNCHFIITHDQAPAEMVLWEWCKLVTFMKIPVTCQGKQ